MKAKTNVSILTKQSSVVIPNETQAYLTEEQKKYRKTNEC